LKSWSLILALAAVSAFSNAAVSAAEKNVTAVRLASPLVIDGILSEDVWTHGNPVSDFIQRDPVEGAAATEKTEIRLAYDDDALYFAARMYDAHPDSIVAQLERKDNGTSFDFIQLFLDPYRDKRTGYYFALNAAGTLYDGTLFNDSWDSNAWDGIWEGKAHIDSQGWTVEMRIPFSQLRFFDQAHQVWGVNIKRNIERKHEQDYLVMTPKKESGFVSRFVELTGIENIDSPRRMEVHPYLTAKAEYLKHDAGDPFRGKGRYLPNLGADLKYGVSSNLTLDGAINPDFGQVEVDPAVVNLSDGETYFNEKRPFFLEGASIFDYGQGGANSNWNFATNAPSFFYTRRIGRMPQGSVPDDASFEDRPAGTRILGAAKVTGNVGGDWNIGTVHAVTSREFARIDRSGVHSDYAVEPLTYYGIARARKELDSSTASIGMMATVTERNLSDPVLKDQFNSGAVVAGLDGWTYLDKNGVWALQGWSGLSNIAGSRQRMIDVQRNSVHYFQRDGVSHLGVDSNATSLSGYAGRFALNKQKGDFLFNSVIGFVSPGFESNDAGFQWKADYITTHVLGGYKWTETSALFRYAEVDAAYYRTYDFGWNSIDDGYFAYTGSTFLNYYSVNAWLAFNPRETMYKDQTRGGPMMIRPRWTEANLNLGSDGTKEVYVSYHIHGVNIRPSWFYNMDGEIRWKVASNLSVSLVPGFSRSHDDVQWIDNVDDPQASATYKRRFIFATLDQRTLSSDIRVNWTFTPELSLQVFMQPLISYNAFTRFKELARPESYDFLVYGEKGSTWDQQRFIADPDGPAGPAAPIEIGDKDFTYKGLRGNIVLRWEYRPGSQIFFVWTQSRNDDQKTDGFDIGGSTRRLLDLKADNIVLVKWSHYFSL
jgi:hypothetical protein